MEKPTFFQHLDTKVKRTPLFHWFWGLGGQPGRPSWAVRAASPGRAGQIAKRVGRAIGQAGPAGLGRAVQAGPGRVSRLAGQARSVGPAEQPTGIKPLKAVGFFLRFAREVLK